MKVIVLLSKPLFLKFSIRNIKRIKGYNIFNKKIFFNILIF